MQLVAIRREYKIQTVVFFIEINYFFIFQSSLPNYLENLSAFHKVNIFDFVEIQPTYYLYLQNTFTTQIKNQMKHYEVWNMAIPSRYLKYTRTPIFWYFYDEIIVEFYFFLKFEIVEECKTFLTVKVFMDRPIFTSRGNTTFTGVSFSKFRILELYVKCWFKLSHK